MTQIGGRLFLYKYEGSLWAVLFGIRSFHDACCGRNAHESGRSCYAAYQECREKVFMQSTWRKDRIVVIGGFSRNADKAKELLLHLKVPGGRMRYWKVVGLKKAQPGRSPPFGRQFGAGAHWAVDHGCFLKCDACPHLKQMTLRTSSCRESRIGKRWFSQDDQDQNRPNKSAFPAPLLATHGYCKQMPLLNCVSQVFAYLVPNSQMRRLSNSLRKLFILPSKETSPVLSTIVNTQKWENKTTGFRLVQVCVLLHFVEQIYTS